MLSLLGAGLRHPMMSDDFLLEVSDLLLDLRALEYDTAWAPGFDGHKISALAIGYRSLQCLSCDITIRSDTFFNTLAPVFPHLKALRTFVHTPVGSPDGLDEWLANWEMPALKGLSLTHTLDYDDWKWLCALLRKNGTTLEYIQFSVSAIARF
jgi:hypothetical protein